MEPMEMETTRAASVKGLKPTKCGGGDGDLSAPPASSSPPTTTACFDCNICLDFAADPVVTLCGHLYCWPCLYRWLQQNTPASSPQCPVCKAAVSQSTLVPLYSRGGSKPSSADVPRRPSIHHRSQAVPTSALQQQQHHHHRSRWGEQDYASAVMPSSSSSVVDHPILRGTAFAVLPWVIGGVGMSSETYYAASPYYLGGGGGSAAARRQEMKSRRSLQRISVFLLCCVVLCLFCF